MHECQYLWKPEALALQEPELQTVGSCLIWVLGTKPRFSSGQQVSMITEPSLQSPLVLYLKNLFLPSPFSSSQEIESGLAWLWEG